MVDVYPHTSETGDPHVDELLVAAMQEVDEVAQQRLAVLSKQL